MRRRLQILVLLALCGLTAVRALGSAYDGQPKLVLILVIDQLRADYLERYRPLFGENGFRMLTDRGAYFLNCFYQYVNTTTAPGHATLLTGSYTSGHGILANQWWDPEKKDSVPAVFDEATVLVGGLAGAGPGASPRKLLTNTLGDELKMATRGRSRVFATSLKDRAAVFGGGFAADGVYWMEPASGVWITSSYYASKLPEWVQRFNEEKRADKYWNRSWTARSGKLLRETRRNAGSAFANVVGMTPFGVEYQLEFARELIQSEKLGAGTATDLLVVGLSSLDLLGHETGPNAVEVEEMLIAMDKELAEFFSFLGRQIGLANVWIALSADHGVSPLSGDVADLRIPAANLSNAELRKQLNAELSRQLGRDAEYIALLQWPQAFLSSEAFAPLKVSQAEAERLAGEVLVRRGMLGYFTKSQLARGEAGSDAAGRRYLNSYSPYAGWYVLGVPRPFQIAGAGANHGSGFSYDSRVPLALFGVPFQAGQYRTPAEPVDLAVTLASLLGINPPAAAQGRVLTEALRLRQAAAAGAAQ